MKEKVFICYRREESGDFVDHLVKKMENRFDVSWDKKIGPVPNVEAEIFRNIDRCSYFIIVLHKDTLDFSTEAKRDDNKWIIKELSHVMENVQKGFSTKIIPVLKEDSTSTITIREPLAPNDINNEEDRELIAKFKIIKDFPLANGIKTNGERLDVFYPKLLSFMGANNFFERNRLKLFILGAILLVGVGVTELICGTYLYKQRDNMKHEVCFHNQKEPTLVFAGGGSVANMIMEMTKEDSIDIKKHNNSLYLDLPSKSAWALLPEEIVHNHTSDSVKNKFYPICLSAVEIENDSVLLKHYSRDYLKKNGIIISYLLGYDMLEVFLDTDTKGTMTTITIDSLSVIINQSINDGKQIFCTQEGSGTYHQYKEILHGKIDLTKKTLKNALQWYNESSSESNHFGENNKGYVILASEHYSPSFVKEHKLQGLKIRDMNDSIISKPMFLYFVAYKRDEGLEIPNAMVKLLKNIVKYSDTFTVDTNQIKHIMRDKSSQKTDDIIIPLEELLK